MPAFWIRKANDIAGEPIHTAPGYSATPPQILRKRHTRYNNSPLTRFTRCQTQAAPKELKLREGQ